MKGGKASVLVRKYPNCHWCGKKMFAAIEVGGAHPDCATIDHIKCRPECSSAEEWEARSNKVLACLACNRDRANKYHKENPNKAGGFACNRATKKSKEKERNARRFGKRNMAKGEHEKFRVMAKGVALELAAAWER